MKSNKPYRKINQKETKAEEPEVAYGLPRQFDINKNFSFNDFKKIAAKVDFTQKEWSDILHISERTLQRYSNDNGTFNTGVVDRILQINKVIQRGKEVFGSYPRFNEWLRDDPSMLEGQLSLQSLATFDGINNILTQLGRIEHGILA